MREIKFRAWDNIDSKMLQYSDIVDSAFFYMCVNERYNMMQYTGLKDNSERKTEIYECDIVLMQDYNFNSQSHTRGVVHFNNEYGCFMIESIQGSEKLKSDSISITIRTMKTNVNDRLVVLGNIYENPELLETK